MPSSSRGSGGFSAMPVFLWILLKIFVWITKLWSFPSKKSTGVEFTLSRPDVNTHQFNITAELLKKAVQIRVEFRRPSRHAFPILLLFRLRKPPHILCVKFIYTFYIAKKFCISFPCSVTECTKDQHFLCTMYVRSIIGKNRWFRSFYPLHLWKVSKFHGTYISTEHTSEYHWYILNIVLFHMDCRCWDCISDAPQCWLW